jgi:hypothetical protein
MRTSTRFSRSCPTCGRLLDIPVDQIGRRVMCTHCHAEFQATLTASHSTREFNENLDERIDRLLAGSTAAPPRPHLDHHSAFDLRSYEV